MAVFTKVFTHRGTAVPTPAIGGAWKTDTHEWTPLPANNCLLVDCQVQPENCHGLSVPPTVIWTPARGPFNATNPCTIDVSYQLALPVARVEYRLHVRLAVPTLINGTSLALTPQPGRILVFEDHDFQGRWRLIEAADANLWKKDNSFWDDRISSFAVLSGNWGLFRHPHFQEAYQNTTTNQSFFGPGLYNRVEYYGIEDNKVSSLLSA